MELNDRNSVGNIINTLRTLPNRIMLAINRDNNRITSKDFDKIYTTRNFKIDKLNGRSDKYSRKNNKYNMRGLLISPVEKEKIKDLVEFASDNVVDTDTMLDIKNGDIKPVGDNPNYVIEIPIGFRIVYSVEQIGENKQRHISVSVEGGNRNKMPNPTAVDMILKEFEMDQSKQNKMYLEEEIGAVNIIAPYIYEMSEEMRESLLSSEDNEKGDE